MIPATNDIRCVACSGGITAVATNGFALVCTHCHTSYPLVWGVPFIGDYEADDILGLIEIAANIRNRNQFGVTPEVVEGWEKLLAAYHVATDKTAFIEENAEAKSPFLPNRYGEWVEVAHLTRGMDLRGKAVLDIGAGLGFDSHRLTMQGARVTALEFSPLLAEAGNIHFQHIRWIGGFSHVLPFKNASFDAVFCNAALHHMRDVPTAISEALRVLRPNGYLITTCDSFLPNNSKEDTELDIFDAEPAVLLGVNEGMPRFCEFVNTFQLHPELLNIELFTHTLYNAPSGGTLTKLTQWDFAKDNSMLSKRSGSLAMRVQLKASWPEPAQIQAKPILTPARYASWLTSESLALAQLASLMPKRYLDLPFPGGRGSKFELLNGWRLQIPNQHARTAYRRGRWFLRRPETNDALLFELGLPKATNIVKSWVEILLDGEVVTKELLTAGAWSPIIVDITRIPAGKVFTLEIRKLDGDESLNGASFVARNRRFIATHGVDAIHTDTGISTVFAVIPVFNRLHFTKSCIRYLKAQQYPALKIVISDGGSTDGTVEAIRTEFPEVTVLESTKELWWAGAMAAGIEYVFRESNNDTDCLLMMNNDTKIPIDYVATLVASSQYFDAAVGGLIVDSHNPTHVLDAGEYVVWSPYSFPVKTRIDSDERFHDGVDVLPGRGSLVPLRMIRSAGNIDALRFPHYLADYEFFYRLKRAGFRLGVSYETHVQAHIEETGIIPGVGVSSFAVIWRELFSRRSMNNVIDHWRFVSLHAPESLRLTIRMRLVARVLLHLGLRTPIRPLILPLWWCMMAPVKALHLIKGQARTFRSFTIDIRTKGTDVLCQPERMPGSIRPLLYLFASPGPINKSSCQQAGVAPEEFIANGVLIPLQKEGWYAFSTLKVPEGSIRTLLTMARRPWFKMLRTIEYHQLLQCNTNGNN